VITPVARGYSGGTSSLQRRGYDGLMLKFMQVVPCARISTLMNNITQKTMSRILRQPKHTPHVFRNRPNPKYN
jgi:hypothetical protein